MTRIHATGLMPPQFGPCRAWCGRLVPIEATMHDPKNKRITCEVCRPMNLKRRWWWRWYARQPIAATGATAPPPDRR
jgi:hypothetical protein